MDAGIFILEFWMSLLPWEYTKMVLLRISSMARKLKLIYMRYRILVTALMIVYDADLG
jgi:hypothetical protein